MGLLEHLHPKLVHFPIALFLSAWVLVVLSQLLKKEPMYKAAMYVYVMAAFSSALAVLSGLWEANRLNLHHPVLYAHRNYAIILLIVSWIGVVAMRRRPLFICFCWLTAVLVFVVGYFGGELVFHYGVGVSS